MSHLRKPILRNIGLILAQPGHGPLFFNNYGEGKGVQRSPKILRTSYVNASSAVEIKYGQVHQERAVITKTEDCEGGNADAKTPCAFAAKTKCLHLLVLQLSVKIEDSIIRHA